MKTITRTNHFSSQSRAYHYYYAMGLTAQDVMEKIQNKEIVIGKPEEKEGREIFLNEEEGRYFVVDN